MSKKTEKLIKKIRAINPSIEGLEDLDLVGLEGIYETLTIEDEKTEIEIESYTEIEDEDEDEDEPEVTENTEDAEPTDGAELTDGVYSVISPVSTKTRGVIVEGEKCRAIDFTGGENSIKYLLENGIIK